MRAPIWNDTESVKRKSAGMTGTIIDRNDMVRRCWTRVDMIEDSHKPFWVTGTIFMSQLYHEIGDLSVGKS